MPRGWVRVLMMVAVGIVTGWGGYWLGHLAGWSTDADWPVRIGAGTEAILLSVGMALAGVFITAVVLARRSRHPGK
jgi:hypothetical protein